MARKLLRLTVTIAASLALTATTFFGIGVWRRSEDAKWCRNATARGAVSGDPQSLTPDLLEQQRSACVVQRQRQRVMFGSVWQKGGPAMAECGFELARLQLLSDEDPKARAAILERYGIDDSGFLTSSRDDQNRFIQACRSNGRQRAR